MSQQCELLGLSRSSYYYEPATESVANLALMALIDKEYTAHPFLGSRGMRSWLRREGTASAYQTRFRDRTSVRKAVLAMHEIILPRRLSLEG